MYYILNQQYYYIFIYFNVIFNENCCFQLKQELILYSKVFIFIKNHYVQEKS